MGAFHRENDGYSRAEARICLNCSAAKCTGDCARLKQEKKRLYEASKPTPLYKLDEEFIIPASAPWPKKNPYINQTKEV